MPFQYLYSTMDVSNFKISLENCWKIKANTVGRQESTSDSKGNNIVLT